MPSFDIVSKVDRQEIVNAVDQANREVTTRYDFKGTDAKFELKENTITLIAPSDFQLQQLDDILKNKMTKRSIDVRSLKYSDPIIQLNEAKQSVDVRQGIDQETAKNVVKIIKNEKCKVQASIQGEQVRVTGKKRDDLQTVIALLEEQSLSVPLQFENFRD